MAKFACASLLFSGLALACCSSDRSVSSSEPNTQALPESARNAVAAPHPEAAATGTILVDVSFAPWAGSAKPLSIQGIDTVTAFVYNSSGDEIRQANLAIAAGLASGRVTVPAQENLRVVLAYMEASVVRFLGEDSDVDVPAGGETTANIVAVHMGTVLYAPAAALPGQSIQLTWMRRPYATGYYVQQTEANDFTAAQVAYAGTDTSASVLLPDAADTLYLRVRANTLHGPGPWSPVVSIPLGPVPTPEGTIVIQTPIPELPDASDSGPKTAVAHPFSFTLDEVAIKDSSTVELFIKVTNISQDTTLYIWADDDITVFDDQGNHFRYTNGWSTSENDKMTISAGQSVYVPVICRTTPGSAIGSVFSASIGYFYDATDGLAYFGADNIEGGVTFTDIVIADGRRERLGTTDEVRAVSYPPLSFELTGLEQIDNRTIRILVKVSNVSDTTLFIWADPNTVIFDNEMNVFKYMTGWTTVESEKITLLSGFEILVSMRCQSAGAVEALGDEVSLSLAYFYDLTDAEAYFGSDNISRGVAFLMKR